jgi:hypothetical protein
MTMSNERPTAPVAEPARLSGGRSLQPLTTLDGVLIYATANGETIGYFFGPTEEAATEAMAEELMRPVHPGAKRTTP